MKKNYLQFYTLVIFILISWFLITSCKTANKQQETEADPYIKIMEQNGGNVFSGNSGGNKPLPGTPYGYEIWSESGTDNRLIWYGPEYGGGAAFRAEWRYPKVFLGRVGLFWDEGYPYTHYNNTYCDFEFTRSAIGSGGSTSYIGIYGWTKDPMIEWYIVEDWYGLGITGPGRIGGGADKIGEFFLDGGTYFIYKAGRHAGAGNILGTYENFNQYFSVRQTTRQSGTISISKHFKEWEKHGLILGANMYEAKFLVEAGSGEGWFDATYISFYQKDN